MALARIASASVLLYGLVFLGGCSFATDHRIPVKMSPTVVASDRSMSLDIENVNGSVLVEVIPGITKPDISVEVLDVSNGVMRSTDNAAVRAWYAADMITQEGRPILRILTTRTDDSLPPTVVSLRVRVPSCDGLRVRNTGGSVEARGVWGPITIENGYRGGVGGPVLLVTSSRIVDAVKLSTTKGDVEMRLNTNSQGTISITSLKGSVELAAKSDALTKVKRTADTFSGVFNAGTNVISLSTGEGTARLDIGDAKGQEPAF